MLISVFVARPEVLRRLRAACETPRTEDRASRAVWHLQPFEQLARRGLVGRDQARGFGGELEVSSRESGVLVRATVPHHAVGFQA